MRITKYTHACVRIEHDGKVLVIDPGVWTEPEAVAGADALSRRLTYRPAWLIAAVPVAAN